MSRTTVSYLERLFATCLGLPHAWTKEWGRPTIDSVTEVGIDYEMDTWECL